MQQAFNLDLMFRTLADGTRRAMIEAVVRGEGRNAGERWRSTLDRLAAPLGTEEAASA